MSLSLGAALGIGAASGLLSGGLNYLTSNAAMDKQIAASQDLWDYQWNKAYSPKAQVKNLTSVGLNPASMFGNTAPVNVGGQMVMPSAPNYNIDVGTQSLTDLAQYIAAGAQAKKAGVEIPGIEEETKGKVLDNSRKEFENDLLKRFGLQKSAAELALAEQNVKLALEQTDVAKKEKAVKDWQAAKEKALSEVNERQRDILQKELDNKDIELDIRNRQGEAQIGLIKSQANAANASAELARANKNQIDTLLPHQETAQILDNGLNALNYDIQNLLKEDNVSKAHSEAIRLRNMAERGEILGRYVPPKEAMSNDTNYSVYDMFEDGLMDIWRKYQRGVQQGIDKSKNK